MCGSVAALESAIVQRLAAALTRPHQQHPCVDVLAWPQRPREFRMTHPHGAALVIYRGSSFAHGATAQQRLAWEDAFELGLIARTLRGPQQPMQATQPTQGGDAPAPGVGMYDLLHTCRHALLGWVPEGACAPVRMVSVDFDDYHEGTWAYSLRFAVPMLAAIPRAGPP